MSLAPTHFRQRSGSLVKPLEFATDTGQPQWEGSLICARGHRHFRVSFFGDLSDHGLICDTSNGCQLVKFECASCDDEFIGFDPKLHGYDADIGNDWLKAGDRTRLVAYECHCSGLKFQLAAGVSYPADLEEEEWEGDRDNAFESIFIEATCDACGSAKVLVEYETA